MSRGILVNDLELGCIKGIGREEVEGDERRKEGQGEGGDGESRRIGVGGERRDSCRKEREDSLKEERRVVKCGALTVDCPRRVTRRANI